MNESDEQRVGAGYDVVYAAIPNSPTFARIWREQALGPGFPAGFEHISFLTLDELRMMADDLQLGRGALLADLACGMGGPGLWLARETGAEVVGIDVSAVALEGARRRAAALGLADVSRYESGTFAETGFEDASVDGAMSGDALQYAPDKQAALHEVARILRRGARFVFVCFEVEPERVAGLPVMGTDPVGDYRPLLEAAGFEVTRYEETRAWRERVTGTYEAIVDAKDALREEMSEIACNALLGEITLTLQVQPYRRRVLVSARKR